ncbi:hypothetical protein C7H19_20015 [Aphanothece hegewaldii CCALA 016]|uniref:Uncharacterized protein n=1 Tax=Aphanothece hegewaldii CCALA 016 TaxID=2107694 RepID=A0A2T1LT31_9CHRO|nr:DUF6753 family protein [Aphanothece hegewaldii]PSF33458.1 hypothetical protein C7H19_20015 [Aphanothece hegewaldii CCALA 016]
MEVTEETADLSISVDQATQSLLAELLADKDEVFRAKVLNLVVKHGLSPNDPLFTILIEVDALQVMLEEAPAAISLSVEQTRQKQEKMTREAITSVQSLIAQSVRELIGKTEALQLRRPSKVLMPGLALFTVVFCLGAIGGIAGTVSLRQLASSGQRLLNLEDAATLNWAKSEEGQYAKKLYEWNEPYLQSGRCMQDMANLGVKLTTGRSVANSGVCALFVVPPDQRSYQ